MGIFSSILDKLRRQGRSDESSAKTTQSQTTNQSTAQANTQTSRSPQQSSAGSQATVAPQAVLQNVDIDAVLADLATKKGGGGNYRQSIVDLLKLLDLDSSLSARTELAEELGVRAGPHGSAEQNIALHKAVMRKLEENGGKVPESMRA